MLFAGFVPSPLRRRNLRADVSRVCVCVCAGCSISVSSRLLIPDRYASETDLMREAYTWLAEGAITTPDVHRASGASIAEHRRRCT